MLSFFNIFFVFNPDGTVMVSPPKKKLLHVCDRVPIGTLNGCHYNYQAMHSLLTVIPNSQCIPETTDAFSFRQLVSLD